MYLTLDDLEKIKVYLLKTGIKDSLFPLLEDVSGDVYLTGFSGNLNYKINIASFLRATLEAVNKDYAILTDVKFKDTSYDNLSELLEAMSTYLGSLKLSDIDNDGTGGSSSGSSGTGSGSGTGGTIGGGGSGYYNPSSSIDDDTITTHGGLINKTKGNLKGKTISSILDAILFPPILPTVVNPSISISGVSSGYKEIGDTLTQHSSLLLNATNVTASLGSVKIGTKDATDSDKKALTRSSGWTSTSFTITSLNWSDKVLEGSQSITFTVGYNKGTKLYDSQYNQITDKVTYPLDDDGYLKAGSILKTYTVIGCYRCRFNDADIELKPLSAGKWFLNGSRYGGSKNTFVCPKGTQVVFKLKNDFSATKDLDGYEEDGSIWTCIDIDTPSSVKDQTIKYVQYSRDSDVENTAGVSLKIETTGYVKPTE